MHIPMKESNELKILTFEEARIQKCSSTAYDESRWIYIPHFYCEYRYILGTVGNNPLITIGINPSTAVPGGLDNTLKSVNRIAQTNGFDSFIMFNIYAQRATKPEHMDSVFNRQLHNENMEGFRWVLEQSGIQPTIWAAWGINIEKRMYLKKCLKDMVHIGNKYHARWCTAGKLTKKGHPRHPLYLRKNSGLYDFDIKYYVEL